MKSASLSLKLRTMVFDKLLDNGTDRGLLAGASLRPPHWIVG
ncbi:MAG TPA: hypothetical protein VHA37_03085 [Candidatus Saccharimonadales bacterium]|nr:hypothetical protein [Candidatus Saccharimonadales bacterium]